MISLVVNDYDEALAFYCDTLGFQLVEDIYQPEQDKRWVVVKPPGNGGSNLLLAQASNPEQASRVGNQTGGRVFLFLYTDDFWRDYHDYQNKGVVFVREPKTEVYGTVAVFEDLYGTRWDLIQPAKPDFATIRALEESLFDYAVRQDPERLNVLLHDDFFEVGFSGQQYDKNAITQLLHNLPQQDSPPHTQNYRFNELAEGLVQVFYDSAAVDADGKLSMHARRTSIWQNSIAGWQIKFHQGTPADPFAANTNHNEKA